MPARIVVVGLGPGGPDLVTAGTLARIAAAERCLLRTTRHPAASVAPHAASFDHVYDRAATLDDAVGRRPQRADRLVHDVDALVA